MKNSKIHIIDDCKNHINDLSCILKSEGYRVSHSPSFKNTTEILKDIAPNLIIINQNLESACGLELCREIKRNFDLEHIPVIFVQDQYSKVGIEDKFLAGAVDFINYPAIPEEVQHRVFTHLKTMSLIGQLKEENKLRRIADESLQRANIELIQVIEKTSNANYDMMREQVLAKKIFDSIVSAKLTEEKFIRHMLSSMSVFNGDVLLANKNKNGKLDLVLGDFTGHGLPAAIGIIPMSDVFYSMSSKEMSMNDILSEINSKLKNLLPTGNFCAAGFVECLPNEKIVKIWNGSLPEILHVNKHGKIKNSYASNHMALGIMPKLSLDETIYISEFDVDDKLFIYSDGVSEAQNHKDELFGQKRLKQIFNESETHDHLFEKIVAEVNAFAGHTQDDLTLVELDFRKLMYS